MIPLKPPKVNRRILTNADRRKLRELTIQLQQKMKRNDPGPTHIGDILPAVLTRRGIEIEGDR